MLIVVSDKKQWNTVHDCAHEREHYTCDCAYMCHWPQYLWLISALMANLRFFTVFVWVTEGCDHTFIRLPVCLCRPQCCSPVRPHTVPQGCILETPIRGRGSPQCKHKVLWIGSSRQHQITTQSLRLPRKAPQVVVRYNLIVLRCIAGFKELHYFWLRDWKRFASSTWVFFK